MPPKYQIHHEAPASELIRAKVAESPTTNCSSKVECGACGRVHESNDENKQIFHSHFNGTLIVLDCECNILSEIEEFLINEREFVVDFYKTLDAFNRRRLLNFIPKSPELYVVK